MERLLSSCVNFLSVVLRFVISICILFIPIVTVCWIILYLWAQSVMMKRRTKSDGKVTIGFFHPYCNAGGGGERVLWMAIKAIQSKYLHVDCYIYTGDTDATEQQIVQNIQSRFNIILPRPVYFIFLKKRKWVESYMYPHFTLLGQSLGSIYLGFEAFSSFVPQVYIDSMGYAFTLPIFKHFGNCKVASYVHYPTISTDMLERVSQRTQSYNNPQTISKSPTFTFIKLCYYQIFAFMYGFVGRYSDIIMVNSTWTKNHINKIWKKSEKTFLVYPPCDIEEFENIPLNKEVESINILSISQFRPEKDHPLQIRAYHALLQKLPEKETQNVKLILIGSSRNEQDVKRVNALQKLCHELGIENNVKFKLNIPFDELKVEMGKATIGIHTMWNEHFGIGVVESMAAGLIMVAHKSGGPLMDIVVDYQGERTGYLASDEDSYTQCMQEIIHMPTSEKIKLIENARNWVKRFSNEEFEKTFLHSIKHLSIFSEVKH